MIKLYSKKTNELIELRREIARSGEGRIYTTNKSKSLAKIYHSIGSERIEKLKVMISNPPIALDLVKNHITIAWPQSLLVDKYGECLGFTMPAIKGGQTLIHVYNPKTRKEKAPEFNWLYLHTTALNIAILLESLHNQQYIVGDLKPDNLLVNRKALVSIIDTDSFQIVDSATQKIYRCPVSSPEYTAREIFDQDFQAINRSEAQDRFSLAIIIWQLLFGDHPFSGKPTNSDCSLSVEQCIRDGYWIYGANSKISPRTGSIPLNVSHPGIQDCFRKSFTNGHINPLDRPTAAHWKNALKLAIKDLVDCPLERNHKYSNRYGICHWCETKKRFKYDLFASLGKPKPAIQTDPNKHIPSPSNDRLKPQRLERHHDMESIFVVPSDLSSESKLESSKESSSNIENKSSGHQHQAKRLWLKPVLILTVVISIATGLLSKCYSGKNTDKNDSPNSDLPQTEDPISINQNQSDDSTNIRENQEDEVFRTEQSFLNPNFPKDKCGSNSEPEKPFYRIYLDGNRQINRMKEFCRDAYYKQNIDRSYLAAFDTKEEAQEFLNQMRSHFKQLEIEEVL